VLFAVEVIGAHAKPSEPPGKVSRLEFVRPTWPKASFEVSVVVSCGATN